MAQAVMSLLMPASRRRTLLSISFWRRVLVPAGQLPWGLVAGNIQENLKELAAGEEPEEPAGKQFWKLMHR